MVKYCFVVIIRQIPAISMTLVSTSVFITVMLRPSFCQGEQRRTLGFSLFSSQQTSGGTVLHGSYFAQLIREPGFRTTYFLL